jgi:hypothetical protein
MCSYSDYICSRQAFQTTHIPNHSELAASFLFFPSSLQDTYAQLYHCRYDSQRAHTSVTDLIVASGPLNKLLLTHIIDGTADGASVPATWLPTGIAVGIHGRHRFLQF